MADVLVVGAGLIGTSLGLALRDTHEVVLSDRSETTVGRATQRGAGRRWDGVEDVDLVVVCTPPRTTGALLIDLIRSNIGSTYTHVSSVQAPVQAEIEASGVDVSRLCGGHPLAGRERSGPDAATALLFSGRTWAVCPSGSTAPSAQQAVRSLAEATGAHPLLLDAQEHDEAVALVSHLPQIAASALAARLVGGPDLASRLAGPGLQDSTRVAASDAALWTEILGLNAGNLAPLVRELADHLDAVAIALAALAQGSSGPAPLELAPDARTAVLTDLLQRGAAGRERVPVKRGERDAAFVVVAVSVLDAPGQLASLLSAAGAGGVNVEDVRVEHVPDSPRGVIELLVRPGARAGAVRVLQDAGWDVLGTSV